MSDLTIAKTIVSQIKTIDPMAVMAWGSKDFVGFKDGVQFKTSGMVAWKGFVKIVLNGSDLYDIEFFRVRGTTVKKDKVVNDIFAEDLVNVIDEQVG